MPLQDIGIPFNLRFLFVSRSFGTRWPLVFRGQLIRSIHLRSIPAVPERENFVQIGVVFLQLLGLLKKPLRGHREKLCLVLGRVKVEESPPFPVRLGGVLFVLGPHDSSPPFEVISRAVSDDLAHVVGKDIQLVSQLVEHHIDRFIL